MTQQFRKQRITTTVVLLVCLSGLTIGLSGLATAQTADYSPHNPYKGMTVTASDGAIQDGEFYDLRVVDSFHDRTVSSHSFVEELEADGSEVVIETDSLEPDAYYFISGPGLSSPTDLTQEQTFELREQTLDVQFGDDEDQNSSDTSSDAQEVGSDSAHYYGTITIDGEPAASNTTIEAEIEGEAHGSITVETTGVYGNESVPEDQLIVDGPAGNETPTVSFYITPPDADRIAADQSVTWEPGTAEQLNLTADKTATSEDDRNDVIDDEPNETTVDANETIDEEGTDDDTTDTAPGFGVFIGIVSLFVIALLGRHDRN